MRNSNSPVGAKLAPVLLGLSLFWSASRLAAAPGDEHWDAQFGWPGPGGNSFSLAVHNGLIYASGTGSILTNVALEVWNGAQWTAQDQFYGPSSTSVQDLTFVGSTLYAVGPFTNVDGMAASGLAKWDGTSWSAPAFSGSGFKLATDGTYLYVGGKFANPGGVTATNIGYWDGAAWHALGNGLGKAGSSDLVRTLIVNNGLVYAAGSFTNSGPLAVTNLAVWNGSAWSAVGGGFPGAITALAASGNNLYVGGIFSQAGTTPANNIAMWNGSTWSALGSGLNGGVNSIVILGNAVDVEGSFTTAGGIPATNFAIWNGTAWAAAGAGGLSSSTARAISTGTNVYVGGNFLLAGGVTMNGITSWDGQNWNQIGTPGRLDGISSFVSAVTSDGTNVYAGGPFTCAGQTPADYIARWDGANWHPVGVGFNNQVIAITVSSNSVYAGGSFSELSNGGYPVPNIARWDGTNWSALALGPGGIVASIVVRSDGVYAAGAPLNSGSYGSPFFSRWDGTNWGSALHFPSNSLFSVLLSDTSIGMDTMAVEGTNIFLGGHFNFAQCDSLVMNCTNSDNVLRFDGSNCWVMAGGLNSNAVAMTVVGTNLYVAGPFTLAGSVAVSQIARWDGTSWWDVGGGVVGRGTVFALTTIGNNLYAGGSFTNMGGVTVNHIAKWDGTNWSALGSGAGIPSGAVESLFASGNDLYAGGTFKNAGVSPSFFFGRWNDQLTFNTPQLINPAWLTNREFRVRLLGIAGMTNIIQASADLNSWAPVLTNSVGVYDFTDTSSSNFPVRFYRAKLGP